MNKYYRIYPNKNKPAEGSYLLVDKVTYIVIVDKNTETIEKIKVTSMEHLATVLRKGGGYNPINQVTMEKELKHLMVNQLGIQYLVT
jgi:hypothetical protein